ncbi:MAG TPA: hypothetical protein VFT46_06510 [Holophagaceae bacterium]|nr:hypothetical protein [Holophagaceae bacterium]
MPALECRHCGAPLPEAAASGPVTCPYCQTVNEPTAAIPRPKVPPPGLSPKDQKEAFKEAIKEEIEQRFLQGRPGQGPQVRVQIPAVQVGPRKAGGCLASLKSCLTTCGCLTVLLGGALVYGFLKEPGTVVRGFKQTLGGGLAPADLRGLQDRAPVTLKVAPPPEGWSAFDPGRDLPWLLAQARAWAPDARLRSLQVIRVRPDGTVDLLGDRAAVVGAEFDSALARDRSLNTHAQSHAQINTGLAFRLARGKLEARLEWGGSSRSGRPDCAALPLKAIFEHLKAAKRLPASPLFSGTLIDDPSRGWVWALQSVATADPMPRVRAEDGALIR